jgi:putative sterol carrier protein
MYTYETEEYQSNYKELLSERLKAETEPFVFLTPEWCAAYEKKIQGDERYKQVARNWEGSVVLVFSADPVAGLERDRFVFLDLWHGECKFLLPVSESVGRSGEFVLQASYEKWVKIVKGELNVVKELATRQLKLVPFDFKKAVKLAGASQAALRLVELAGAVGARYPGELSDDEQVKYKDLSEKLRRDYGI